MKVSSKYFILVMSHLFGTKFTEVTLEKGNWFGNEFIYTWSEIAH